MLINGQAVAAADGATFARLNPLDGTLATTAPAAGAADAQSAADAAAQAFPAWAATGPGERRKLLMKAAAALEAQGDAFAQAMARETGASGLWAGFNVHLAADMLLEAAALTTQVSGELIPSDLPGSLATAVRQPAGVVLGIAPWNAPVILGVRAIAVPLAMGNTVVLKGSELCPATHGLIVQALQEAGLPPGGGQLCDQRTLRCRHRGRGPDCPPGGQARQLHRFHPCGQDHCRHLRKIPQALGAGTRRQGPPAGAR